VAVEKAFANAEIADVRLTASRVDEHKMQLVLPDCSIVSLDNRYGFRVSAFGDCIYLS
jgi:hypothetical protein